VDASPTAALRDHHDHARAAAAAYLLASGRVLSSFGDTPKWVKVVVPIGVLIAFALALTAFNRARVVVGRALKGIALVFVAILANIYLVLVERSALRASSYSAGGQ
jgi:hypothetical protein